MPQLSELFHEIKGIFDFLRLDKASTDIYDHCVVFAKGKMEVLMPCNKMLPSMTLGDDYYFNIS